MLINEIEVVGSSFNCSSYVCGGEIKVDQLFEVIMQKADMFSLETELPGFHDCECKSGLIRGFYSFIEPFEVESLERETGITQKELKKRIRTCEFITDGTLLVAFGNNNAKKLLATAIWTASGENVDLHKFEFEEINRAQLRMTTVKSVTVTNPKEKEIRKCRMSGHIEAYTEYNVLDPRNHGLAAVSGWIDTPLGKMVLTVAEKGQIKLGAKKGLILTWELLTWVFDLIIGKHEQRAAEKKEIEALEKEELDALSETKSPAVEYLKNTDRFDQPQTGHGATSSDDSPP